LSNGWTGGLFRVRDGEKVHSRAKEWLAVEDRSHERALERHGCVRSREIGPARVHFEKGPTKSPIRKRKPVRDQHDE